MSDNGILNRIEQVMINAGMSQAQFAEALGMSRAGMNHVFHGRNGISDKLKKRICYTFGVRAEWLESGSGTPYVNPDEEAFTGIKPSQADVVRVTITQALKKMPDEDVMLLGHFIDMISGLRAGGMDKYYPDWSDPHDDWAEVVKDKRKD